MKTLGRNVSTILLSQFLEPRKGRKGNLSILYKMNILLLGVSFSHVSSDSGLLSPLVTELQSPDTGLFRWVLNLFLKNTNM